MTEQSAHPAVFRPLQQRFLAIPQTPLSYWLRERFFELLAGRTLGDVADVCQGLATANDARFVRFTWEAPPAGWARPVRQRRWVPFEKGGGYGKWFGHHFWVVDWQYAGARIKASPTAVIRNEQYYFEAGWTYSWIARGSLGLRIVGTTGIIAGAASSGVFALDEHMPIGSILNCRFSSAIVRSISAKIQLPESYVSRVPVPESAPAALTLLQSACVALKRHLVALDPTERTFRPSPLAPLPQRGRGVASGASRGEGRGEGRLLRGESSVEIRELARVLRQADNGPEEMLWEALRDRRLLSLKFRRQQPLGPFIVDFYCADLRLAVEVDGGIHSVPAVRNHDTARDEWLSQRGVRVIRISADGILGSLEETLTAIADAARRPSPLAPLPRRGRGVASGASRGEGRGEGRNASWQLASDGAVAVAAVLHTLEGLSERLVFAAYDITGDDLAAVLDETGIPAGWYSLIRGYDAVPPLPDGLAVPDEVLTLLGSEPRVAPDAANLAALKRRLRSLYEAGPGGSAADSERAAAATDDEVDEVVTPGASIPIPTETFLEELAQKLELHPISVYWLLEELRQEGVRGKPEEQRLLEDRLSVLVLRLLGHRWPEQVAAGEPAPEWAEPGGIIPLTAVSGKATLAERLRARLRAGDGDLGAQQTEALLAELTGLSLEDWLRRQFFARHVRQFRYRPIAWHLASRPLARTGGQRSRSGRVPPAFECLLYYHACGGDILARLRTQHIEPLLQRTRARAEEDRRQQQESGAGEQVRELEAFTAALRHVEETGFACPELDKLLATEPLDRWSGDGQWSPGSREELVHQERGWHVDSNDGVRVNIAPLQLAGLLASDVLKTADAARAIAGRARWRAGERRWVREGKLPRCGWMPESVRPSEQWIALAPQREAEQRKLAAKRAAALARIGGEEMAGRQP